MTQNSEVPPLPEAADYEKAIERTDYDFGLNGGPKRYIDSYLQNVSHQKWRSHKFFRSIADLGSLVEPFDRSTMTYVDDDNATHQAFIKGSVAGLVVVRNLHQGVVAPENVFEGFTLPTPGGSNDTSGYRHTLGSYVVDFGEQGIELTGRTTEEVIDGWETDVVPDVRTQRMFRVGLGVVALSAYRFHESAIQIAVQHDIDEFHERIEAAGGIDWDAEAAKLFGDL